MTKKKENAIMGRPKKELDLQQIKNLCKIQATQEEIAAVFEVSIDTIQRRLKEATGLTFAQFFRIHGAHGKVALRRKGFKEALENGNTTILKMLLNYYLGIREKQSIEHEIGESQFTKEQLKKIAESYIESNKNN